MAKQIKSLDDAQKAINDLYNQLETRRTKDWDFHGLRIKNASDGVDPQDYATVNQLPQAGPTTSQGKRNYTIVFSKDGIVTTGEDSPAYIVGIGKEGIPSQIWVSCEPGSEPSGGDLIINVSWTRVDLSNNEITTNLLSQDLHLPNGSHRAVVSSKFINPTPRLGSLSKINKVIINGANAGFVSIGLVVQEGL